MYHFIKSGSPPPKLAKDELPKVCFGMPNLPQNMYFVPQRISHGNQFIKTKLKFDDLLPASYIGYEDGFFHFDSNKQGKRFTATIGIKE